jgi:hypothetical protein
MKSTEKCVGCLAYNTNSSMFCQCGLSEKAAKKCPCRKCLVKTMCNEACIKLMKQINTERRKWGLVPLQRIGLITRKRIKC